MKRFIIVILPLLFLFSCASMPSFLGSKSRSNVYTYPSHSADALFRVAEETIAAPRAATVMEILYSDITSGMVIAQGIAYFPAFLSEYKVKYTMQVEVREGRIRIIMKELYMALAPKALRGLSDGLYSEMWKLYDEIARDFEIRMYARESKW